MLSAVTVIVCMALLAASVALLAGCSQGKPQVIVFMSKSSKSYQDVKAMVDKAKKKFGDKVTWVTYDYDKASSAGAKKKYYVSMNPTIIITNTKGEIKQTYMGKPMEDDLMSKIESYIPSSGGKTTTPGSTPGTVTVPGTTVPMEGTSTPGVVPNAVQTVP